MCRIASRGPVQSFASSSVSADALGKSSKSLVSDDSDAVSVGKRDERRWRIAEELRDTEKAYVAVLEEVDELYYQPLLSALPIDNPLSRRSSKRYSAMSAASTPSHSPRQSIELQTQFTAQLAPRTRTSTADSHLSDNKSSQTASSAQSSILSRREINEIFSNFADVLNLSRFMLATLEEAILPRSTQPVPLVPAHKSTTSSTASRSAPDQTTAAPLSASVESGALSPDERTLGSRPHQRTLSTRSDASRRRRQPAPPLALGKALLPVLPFLKQYSLFCVNYGSALSRLARLEQSTIWREFVAKQEKLQAGKIGLAGLLLSILAPATPSSCGPSPLPTTDDSRSTKEFKSGLGGKLSSFLGGSKARDRSSSFPKSAKYASFSTPSDAPPVPRPEMGERRETDASGSSDLLGGGPSGGGMPPPLEPQRTGSGQQEKRKSLMPGSSLFRRPSRAGTQLSDFDERAGAPSAPQYASAMSAEPAEAPGTARVDEEGYSMPPEGYDRAIGEPRSGTGRSLLDNDDEPLGESYGTSIPKVSITPSLPSSPVVAQESEAECLAALESVKNALGAPPAAAAGAGLGRRATARGRRGEGGARNTVYGGAGGLATPPQAERQDSTISEEDVPLATVVKQKHRREAPPPPVGRAAAHTPNETASTLSPSLPTSPVSPGFIPPSPAPVAGRAMSVMSDTSSLGPAAGHGRPDPFSGVTSPGLRASIVETVNVLLKAGEVTRVLVTGEVGLSYRPSSASPGGQLQLRLTGLDGLEKTAPNPSLLSIAGAGDFTVSPSLAAHNGTTVTAFKYQVSLLPTSSSALVPLIVKPTWRCEPGLARAIVTYSANTSSTIFSALPSSSPFGEDDDSAMSARLEDVKLDLVLASGVATSFQTKPPSGILTNSNRTLSFSIGSVDAANGGEQKILASIHTEGAAPAQPGPISVSWVVRGRAVSNVGVEVVEGGEAIEEVRRETVSGKYLAA